MSKECCVKTKLECRWGMIDIKHPEQYHPWISARQFTKSEGRRHTFPDYKHEGRMISLFSDLEYEAYQYFCADKRVEEVFEQVALNPRITLDIADKADVQHPRDPKTGEYIVMTTDFVVYIGQGCQVVPKAYAVKPSNKLKDKRICEKLKIEKCYWDRMGVQWQIITEKSLAMFQNDVRR